ncbi:MAG: hypothetical protein AAF564_13410 [Bacteroidota bacterium]
MLPHQYLRVSPQFAIYLLEKERLVVLYNATRSLLLSGANELAIFTLLDRPHSPWISVDELFGLPEKQQLIIANLFKENILCYFNFSEAHSNGTVYTGV